MRTIVSDVCDNCSRLHLLPIACLRPLVAFSHRVTSSQRTQQTTVWPRITGIQFRVDDIGQHCVNYTFAQRICHPFNLYQHRSTLRFRIHTLRLLYFTSRYLTQSSSRRCFNYTGRFAPGLSKKLRGYLQSPGTPLKSCALD